MREMHSLQWRLAKLTAIEQLNPSDEGIVQSLIKWSSEK